MLSSVNIKCCAMGRAHANAELTGILTFINKLVCMAPAKIIFVVIFLKWRW